MRGKYNSGLDPRSAMALQLHLQDLNKDFANTMTQSGHTKIFQTAKDEIDNEYAQSPGDTQNIYEWIHELYLDSRGAELPGTVSPAVIENLFHQQSVHWEDIANRYLNDVTMAIKNFNEGEIEKTMNDCELRRKLRVCLECCEDRAFKHAHDQLKQLLKDEREGILQTVNHNFADTLAAIREEHVLARLQSTGIKSTEMTDIKEMKSHLYLSNKEQAVNDIHDTLKAYYKVALKRFTDNIVQQVTERHLLGLCGPAKTLTPEFIGELLDRESWNIAGENSATSSVHIELQICADRSDRPGASSS